MTVTFDLANRNRSALYSGAPDRSAKPEFKRNHSVSVSSVSSRGSVDLLALDLEKQLILTAGGRREQVICFLLKLLFLCSVVVGCGVLVFYAL